jgi:drug/metabolite transporter (DMT)-like permease
VDLTISRKQAKLLFLRCIFGTLSICFQFYALSNIVLTDAVMIVCTSPVITFALGAVILRETIDRIDFAAAIVSYSGVVFVTRPALLFPSSSLTAATSDDSSARTDGVLSAMAAAVCQACAYIVMRKLHDVHHAASIHYFSGFGVCFSLVMLALFRVVRLIHRDGTVVTFSHRVSCSATDDPIPLERSPRTGRSVVLFLRRVARDYDWLPTGIASVMSTLTWFL